jgi:hypothetical protein
MHYSLIGAPTDQEPWPLRPAFRALRLLSRAVEPGWTVLRVSGGTDTQLVVAFADPSDPSQLTIAGLDKAGGNLNAKTTRLSTYAQHVRRPRDQQQREDGDLQRPAALRLRPDNSADPVTATALGPTPRSRCRRP